MRTYFLLILFFIKIIAPIHASDFEELDLTILGDFSENPAHWDLEIPIHISDDDLKARRPALFTLTELWKISHEFSAVCASEHYMYLTKINKSFHRFVFGIQQLFDFLEAVVDQRIELQIQRQDKFVQNEIIIGAYAQDLSEVDTNLRATMTPLRIHFKKTYNLIFYPAWLTALVLCISDLTNRSCYECADVLAQILDHYLHNYTLSTQYKFSHKFICNLLNPSYIIDQFEFFSPIWS